MTLVAVTVARGAVVYHDGRAHDAGQTLFVSKANAETLVAAGIGTLVKPDARPKRSRAKAG